MPQRPRALTVRPPLKILAMISSPHDYPPLDVEHEWRQLKEALVDLEGRGLLSLERIDSANLAALQARLQRSDVHVFHFIGHGKFDERDQDGLLLFEDENKRGRPLSAQYLGPLLHNHRALRLVVLNSCEGARASPNDPFSGAAQSLVQQGIPAVVAMQFEITDRAASTFAHGFYSALAAGYPVDAALVQSRTAIFAQGNDIEWGTPVCFTRAPSGQLFDLQRSPVPPIVPKDVEKPEEPEVPEDGKVLPRFPKQTIIWSIVIILLIAVSAVLGGRALLERTQTQKATRTAAALLAPVLTDTLEPTLPSALTPTFTGTPTRAPTNTYTPTNPPSPTALPSQITDGFGVPMALVPAGSFQMGSEYDSESPVHTVMLDAFYIDIYEVTNLRYAECVDAGECASPGVCSDFDNVTYVYHPVVCIDWSEAQAYCKWRGARLPTEAEWEKAARGKMEGRRYP